MKKLLIATVLAAGFAFAAPQASEAGTSIHIYLGIPHYSYRVGPDYLFRPGYGWYRRPTVAWRISCGAGRNLLASRGFHNIDTVECGGPVYTYRATRNGNRSLWHVDARNGQFFR